MGRTLLAGLAGGIVMFIWLAGAHMSPLAEIGVKEAPKGSAAVAALDADLKQSGFYMFPGSGLTETSTKAEQDAAMKAQMADMATKSFGIIVYNQPGTGFGMAPALIKEFIFDLVQALVVAFVVAGSTAATFGRRVGVASLIGFGALVATNSSYHIWYGFPLDYTLAYMFIGFVGYVVAGLAIAFVLGRKGAATA
ncbi:hypothetical protein QO010_003462 [Caulobacter ginsengisoli]|uniref:Uncharacterized protein n=1 Tax=Caulobacter ginsengisoli TaxID=400775 RepID=A0ABU0IWX0_9CAUL|nr:hypothetical protein [Caulobacter ginsengisoli]MDQ0465673.1 hypothetical protein [Caulobacter ginsengisoli]